MTTPYELARRLGLLSIGVSLALAVGKIWVGSRAGSAAVVADGIESAGDVLASGLVVFALLLAERPPDEDHPYGHGRVETLTGLGVGLLLAVTGAGLVARALTQPTGPPPAAYAVWPLLVSILVKAGLALGKLRTGRRIRSDALLADAWNDTVDILSGFVALVAVGLTQWDPARFAAADRLGAAVVGLIVVLLGCRVVRDTALTLMDTMPDASTLDQIRRAALAVPGARGIEKCFARKTGLMYHVDLHLEVDPELTVRDSHEIASRVRSGVRAQLPWVADVLIHVEPYGVEPHVAEPHGVQPHDAV